MQANRISFLCLTWAVCLLWRSKNDLIFRKQKYRQSASAMPWEHNEDVDFFVFITQNNHFSSNLLDIAHVCVYNITNYV